MEKAANSSLYYFQVLSREAASNIHTQGFVFTIVHVCSLYKFCVYVHITNRHDIT